MKRWMVTAAFIFIGLPLTGAIVVLLWPSIMVGLLYAWSRDWELRAWEVVVLSVVSMVLTAGWLSVMLHLWGRMYG